MKALSEFNDPKNVPDLSDSNKDLMDTLGFAPMTPNQFKEAQADYRQYKLDTGDDIGFEDFLALMS